MLRPHIKHLRPKQYLLSRPSYCFGTSSFWDKFRFRDPSVKRTTYKIPSVIRKNKIQTLAFRNPEDTLFKKHPVKQGPSERLFVVEKRRLSDTQQRNYIVIAMVLSLIPIFYGFYNSQELLRKYEVKSISRKRRERLDKEHGVDRELFNESIGKLDEAYRVSEKEEIHKLRQLGKSPKEYFARKSGTINDEDVDEIIKQELLKDEDGRIITVKTGKDYERVEVTSEFDDSPDPRVHGAKVIFDSRLDEFTRLQKDNSKDSLNGPHYPKITLKDKKEALFGKTESTHNLQNEEVDTELKYKSTSKPSFRKKPDAEASSGEEERNDERVRFINERLINLKKELALKGIPIQFVDFVFENYHDLLYDAKKSKEEINAFIEFLSCHFVDLHFKIVKPVKPKPQRLPKDAYTLEYLSNTIKTKESVEQARSVLNSDFTDFKDCVLTVTENEATQLLNKVNAYEPKKLEPNLLRIQVGKLENLLANYENQMISFDKNKIDANIFNESNLRIDRFLKNNPAGKTNPLYRHCVIENRKDIIEKYGKKLLKEEFAKIKEINIKTAHTVGPKEFRDHLFQNDLDIYHQLKRLEACDRVFTDDVLLSNHDITQALDVLDRYSAVMKLPRSIVTQASDAYQFMIGYGIPNSREVEVKAKSLSLALKNLVEIMRFEKFDDVKLEELKSRISNLRWRNYWHKFVCTIKGTNEAHPNEIITLTESNLEAFLKLAEEYKKIDDSEKESLHQLSTLENSLKVKNYFTIYSALENNSQFLNYLVDGQEDFKVIQAYLVYQVLKEINFLQNFTSVN